MRCLYIIIPILIFAAILVMQLRTRARTRTRTHPRIHPDKFGVNAGYYLSGDGGWAGQMQPASVSVDGDTGLVPIPKAGQQNSYLRGDGKWIQANNAPTSTQYAYATTTEPVKAVSNNSMVPSGWYFPFNVVTIAGNYITSTTSAYAGTNKSTIFTLAPNSVYKCSFALGGYGDSGGTQLPQNIYGWYDITNGVPIGVFASYTNQTNSVATGIVAATTQPIKIGVMFSYVHPNGITVTPYAAYQYGPLNSWATIELVSTGNTISQFTGAGASTQGSIGYIPAPLAGQQNYYLTGSGTWQPPPKQQYLLAVGSENQLWRKNYMASVWVSFGQCCVTSFCQLRDGSFLGVGVDNAVYTLANLNAKWIYGGDNTKAVKHVTQLSDGTLLGVGMDNQLYTKTTLTAPWILIPASGAVTSVIQLQDGRIVGIGTDNAMYIKTSLTAGWTYGGDNTKSVSCVTQLQDGSLIGIGLDYKLYSRAHMQANWVYGGDNTCCVKCIVAILL